MEQETNQITTQPTVQSDINSMKKNQKIGLIFLIAPIMGIIVAIAGFVVMGFVKVLFDISSDGNSIFGIFLNIINFLLGVLGMVSVLGCIIGLPLGIYFLVKK